MIRATLLSALAIAALSTASASPSSEATKTVALFDELVSCAANSSFSTYGLSRNGPCGDWVDRVKRQRAKDGDMMKGGFFCLAGDVEMAGQSLISGDQSHFQFVRDAVEQCRAKLG